MADLNRQLTFGSVVDGLARPALSLMAPRLRTGAVVICDNTEQFREAYADYFGFIRDARNADVHAPFPAVSNHGARVND